LFFFVIFVCLVDLVLPSVCRRPFHSSARLGYDLLLARDLRSLQPDELSKYVRDQVK
jgi:hypothetical protein